MPTANTYQRQLDFIAAVGADRPARRVLVPLGPGHPGVEQGVVHEVEAISDGFEVAPDLLTEGVPAGRDVVELLEHGDVHVRLDVAHHSGVAVPVPGAPDAACQVDDANPLDAGFAELRSDDNSGDPPADDDDVDLVCDRVALDHRREGVVAVAGEVLIVPQVANVGPARDQSLVAFGKVLGAHRLGVVTLGSVSSRRRSPLRGRKSRWLRSRHGSTLLAGPGTGRRRPSKPGHHVRPNALWDRYRGGALRRYYSFGIAVLLAGLVSACGASGPAVSTTTSTGAASTTTSTGASSTQYAATVTSPGPVNPAAIPLGDGYVSSSAKVGYIDSCVTNFSSLGIGGAQVVGPWVDTATKTWDSLTKIAVQGTVSWPQATFSVTVSGQDRNITGNDLPIGHTTGTFPISSTDPAYAYDRNPNTITPQSISWSLPLNPVAAAQPGCLGLGPIGVLDDGVYLFDALDGEGRDAAAHEVLDNCEEHPQMGGVLHHHDVPSCMLSKATGTATLVGYAADGYGIYVERTASGALLTNSDLDACHGRTSPVLWNGKVQDVYHYDATLEYPYTVGCYHGTPISVS